MAAPMPCPAPVTTAEAPANGSVGPLPIAGLRGTGGLQQLQGDAVRIVQVDVPSALVDPLGDLDGLVYQPGAERPETLRHLEDVVDDEGEMARAEGAPLEVCRGACRALVADE